MNLSFSIADGGMDIDIPLLSRSKVEAFFAMVEAQILNTGRVILQSGNANVKNPRWIKEEIMFLKSLSILLEESFWYNDWKIETTRLAGARLVAFFSFSPSDRPTLNHRQII